MPREGACRPNSARRSPATGVDFWLGSFTLSVNHLTARRFDLLSRRTRHLRAPHRPCGPRGRGHRGRQSARLPGKTLPDPGQPAERHPRAHRPAGRIFARTVLQRAPGQDGRDARRGLRSAPAAARGRLRRGIGVRYDARGAAHRAARVFLRRAGEGGVRPHAHQGLAEGQLGAPSADRNDGLLRAERHALPARNRRPARRHPTPAGPVGMVRAKLRARPSPGFGRAGARHGGILAHQRQRHPAGVGRRRRCANCGTGARRKPRSWTGPLFTSYATRIC